MSEPRHAAVRKTWGWRPAGFARLGGVLIVIALIAFGSNLALSSKGNSDATTSTTLASSSTTGPVSTTTTVPTPLNKIVPPGPLASSRRLSLYKVITGDISPKSVMSTNTGLVFARHDVSPHDDRRELGRHAAQDHQRRRRAGTLRRPRTTRPDPWRPRRSGRDPHGKTSGSRTTRCTGQVRFRRVRHWTPGWAVAAGDTPSFLMKSAPRRSRSSVSHRSEGRPNVAVTPNDKYVVATNWCSWTVRSSMRRRTTSSRRFPSAPIARHPDLPRLTPRLHRHHGQRRDRRHQPFDL